MKWCISLLLRIFPLQSSINMLAGLYSSRYQQYNMIYWIKSFVLKPSNISQWIRNAGFAQNNRVNDYFAYRWIFSLDNNQVNAFILSDAGRHGKLYSFSVSHVFNYKNNFKYYWKNILNFNFLFCLEFNFKILLRHRKRYKFPVSWLFLIIWA